MTETTHATILRRMTRAHDADAVENPLTSSRAVRLALTKAANDASGLVLTVSSVAEDVNALDATLDALPAGLMLVGLQRNGQLAGLIALDVQLRAAVLEVETMGVVSPIAADERPPTQTDKMMCDPFLAQFLSAFPDAVQGTALDGWGDHVMHDALISDVRTAGLLLEDTRYRSVQMVVQLGATDRQGLLTMTLPVQEATNDLPEPLEVAVSDWATEFPNTVNDAPACLTALLHKFSISLATAQQLGVGTVLALPGCRVSSVKLVAPDEKVVAQAKLGQSGGMRAVRIEREPLPDLNELEPSIVGVSDHIPLATAAIGSDATMAQAKPMGAMPVSADMEIALSDQLVDDVSTSPIAETSD